MRIKMLNRAKGADDGYTVLDYRTGEEYDVGDILGSTFISGGHAELIGKPVAASAPEANPSKDPAGRGRKWSLTMSPSIYLERYPEGKQAALAAYVLGQTEENPLDAEG